MLIKPSIDNLLEKVENKYALVILASQRGRQIRLKENDKKNDEKFGSKNAINKLKEVSVALKEIDEDLVESYYKNNEEQIEDILNDKINEEIAMLYQSDLPQTEKTEQPE
ncbi:DNA-directed RNA polymerase subunit omega [Clostridium sp. 'deep sea']|uniref:DNA-directed RNA polymerase subunit omega n=1 Tax=Clostridium sp. 'deep sea' TaxID=2779445 RepID=UPI001A9B3847|nr:DNA-directed RNA polymerase subunit omega [Clostridium sp. 'deep sea']